MAFIVRPSRPGDGSRLRDIERRAGERFRDAGLDSIADDEPLSVATLGEFARSGRGWVVVDGDDDPFGYVLVEVVDGCAHVEQMSVEPDHQGRGAGRALIDQVRAWAVAGGMPAITLTTFRDIPWNRPLYEHLGFRVLEESEISPGLRAVRDGEKDRGLDPSVRVCMGLELP